MPWTGPSRTMRMSWTCPTSPPPASITVDSRRSLARIVVTSLGSGDALHGPAGPTLGPDRVELVAGHGQAHVRLDRPDHAERDPRWLPRSGQPETEGGHSPGRSPEPRGERAGAGENPCEHGWPGPFHRRELQIVDLAGHQPILVDQLSVQEVDAGVDRVAGVLGDRAHGGPPGGSRVENASRSLDSWASGDAARRRDPRSPRRA